MTRPYQILVLALVACAGPQRPVHIGGAQPIDAVARALAAAGQPPAEVRPDGIITTAWVDTGFLYGQFGTQPASIVRRYVAVVGPADVVVRAETQRCARGSWDPISATGACEQMDGLVPDHQAALDDLGKKLRAALVGSQTPGGRP